MNSDSRRCRILLNPDSLARLTLVILGTLSTLSALRACRVHGQITERSTHHTKEDIDMVSNLLQAHVTMRESARLWQRVHSSQQPRKHGDLLALIAEAHHRREQRRAVRIGEQRRAGASKEKVVHESFEGWARGGPGARELLVCGTCSKRFLSNLVWRVSSAAFVILGHVSQATSGHNGMEINHYRCDHDQQQHAHAACNSRP